MALPEVVNLRAAVLSIDPSEIEERLLDQSRAVLGVAPRPVSRYRNGVNWEPADDKCVAGELVGAEPVDECWAIRGEIVELSR